MFTVNVFSGDVLIESYTFGDERMAVFIAGKWQDQGFKVRVN